MTIYRHYKSHLYRYLGVVKHSETLEELVSYQCLYDNPEGQFWVRPKAMFFESIKVEERSIPRFEKLDLSMESFSALTSDRMQQLVELASRIFPGFSSKAVLEEWTQLPLYQLLIASLDNKAVGFNLSYPLTRDIYFLWLEGVLPEFQGLGIGTSLIESQIDWCSDNNFRVIITKPLANDQSQLIHVLKRDFSIVGIEDSQQGLRVVCEKKLPDPKRR